MPPMTRSHWCCGSGGFSSSCSSSSESSAPGSARSCAISLSAASSARQAEDSAACALCTALRAKSSASCSLPLQSHSWPQHRGNNSLGVVVSASGASTPRKDATVPAAPPDCGDEPKVASRRCRGAASGEAAEAAPRLASARKAASERTKAFSAPSMEFLLGLDGESGGLAGAGAGGTSLGGLGRPGLGSAPEGPALASASAAAAPAPGCDDNLGHAWHIPFCHRE
mmetsp:Transcript_51107/g.146736  ORF Transcript_51107/g.146736 Transcript_51107/m.146736 type:complete len:226 (-) Transcript_51107:266-943(-)